MSRGDKPAYNVRARQELKSDYLTTVGSAWKFKEGDGYVVRILSLPVDWDRSFILVKPSQPETAQTTEAK
jgi:hypothetical protein